MPGLGRPLRGVHIKGLVRALTKTLSDSWGDPTGGEQQGAQLSGASHGGGYTTDLSDTLFKRAASAMESLLLALEDRLRQRDPPHCLPPFVLGQEDALSALQIMGGRLVVADFERNNPPDRVLSGNFRGAEVTSEQLKSLHTPGIGGWYLRLRFSLTAREHYGEFGEFVVKVRDEASDWIGYQTLNLWYRGRSRAAKLTLTFKDALGQRWFSSHGGVLTGGRWQLLSVPFSNFHCSGESRKIDTLDLKNVSEMSFQISCSKGCNGCQGWVDLYEVSISKT